ncbi:hypothetical protein [Pseudomonas putida]|uniref:Uncharacterized protein n=1 Tax=Pseudomonas putida TaxID=303 RepID=A0A7V8EJ39_PSEPU|nr:hypothetical protein [Pseudomonas putida]KAF0255749.1 hypothetical protein GN299_06570 [Pseudomonas putida]
MDNTPQEPKCTHQKISRILGVACVTGVTQCGFWFDHIAQQTVSGFTWQLYTPLLVTIALCAWAFKVNRDTRRQWKRTRWIRRDGSRLP